MHTCDNFHLTGSTYFQHSKRFYFQCTLNCLGKAVPNGVRCHNQTSIRHLSRNKLNTKYFTCDNWKMYLTSISMVLQIWIN